MFELFEIKTSFIIDVFPKILLLFEIFKFELIVLLPNIFKLLKINKSELNEPLLIILVFPLIFKLEFNTL